VVFCGAECGVLRGELCGRKKCHFFWIYFFAKRENFGGDFLPWFPLRLGPCVAALDWRDEEARDSGGCFGSIGGWDLRLGRWQDVGAGVWS
jgi:hypothetical protein